MTVNKFYWVNRMNEFIAQLMETIENAREHFEDSKLEGTLSGDPSEVLILLVDIYDELEALQADEEE